MGIGPTHASAASVRRRDLVPGPESGRARPSGRRRQSRAERGLGRVQRQICPSLGRHVIHASRARAWIWAVGHACECGIGGLAALGRGQRRRRYGLLDHRRPHVDAPTRRHQREAQLDLGDRTRRRVGRGRRLHRALERPDLGGAGRRMLAGSSRRAIRRPSLRARSSRGHWRHVRSRDGQRVERPRLAPPGRERGQYRAGGRLDALIRGRLGRRQWRPYLSAARRELGAAAAYRERRSHSRRSGHLAHRGLGRQRARPVPHPGRHRRARTGRPHGGRTPRSASMARATCGPPAKPAWWCAAPRVCAPTSARPA
jgi:hypothetical protein